MLDSATGKSSISRARLQVASTSGGSSDDVEVHGTSPLHARCSTASSAFLALVSCGVTMGAGVRHDAGTAHTATQLACVRSHDAASARSSLVANAHRLGAKSAFLARHGDASSTTARLDGPFATGRGGLFRLAFVFAQDAIILNIII